MVVYTQNPSTQETEAGGLRIQSQPRIHNENKIKCQLRSPDQGDNLETSLKISGRHLYPKDPDSPRGPFVRVPDRPCHARRQEGIRELVTAEG